MAFDEAAYQRRYQSVNKERLSEYRKRYWADPVNKQRKAALGKASYQANREECIARAVQYKASHPEMAKESHQRRKRKDPERVKALGRATTKRFYAAHPERCKSRIAEWRRSNPDAVVSMNQGRRALKLNAQGSYTAEEWSRLKEQTGNRCLCCGTPATETLLTVDHVVPLVQGGRNSIDNLQPLCKSFNSRKHTQMVDYRRQAQCQ